MNSKLLVFGVFLLLASVGATVVGWRIWRLTSDTPSSPTLPSPSPQTKLVLPPAVLSGMAKTITGKGEVVLAIDDYPLEGPEIKIGRIYKAVSATEYIEIQLVDLAGGEKIFVDYYHSPQLTRGLVAQLNLTAQDLAKKFAVEDPSGLFWKKGGGVDNLKPTDVVEVTSDRIKYIAPALAAVTGQIQITNRTADGLTVRIKDVEITVDKDTVIYDGRDNQKILGLDQVYSGYNVYALYYLRDNQLQAKSLGLNVGYEW